MKPTIKNYFEQEGYYLFRPDHKHVPLFLGETSDDDFSLAADLSDVYLLLRTHWFSPTFNIPDNLLRILIKPNQPLKFCLAVNTVVHWRVNQAVQRRPELPHQWFCIKRDDENSEFLSCQISAKPRPKYEKTHLMYDWSQELEADFNKIPAKYLSSIKFLVSANCEKRVTVFEVSPDFLKFVLLSKRGLNVSVLNERY